MKHYLRYVILPASILFLVSCATQPGVAEITPDVPGFLFGIWHGAIAPFALVASFFSDVRIYAYPNSGIFYDCGYILGLAWFSIIGR